MFGLDKENSEGHEIKDKSDKQVQSSDQVPAQEYKCCIKYHIKFEIYSNINVKYIF